MCKFTDLPLLGHGLVERIFWVGSTEQSLDTEQDCADLESRRPVVLQNVQADATQPVDVGVIDASQEAYPRWAHGVVVRKEELEVELAACHVVSGWVLSRVLAHCPGLLTFVATSIRSIHPNVEVSCVLIVRLSRDARNRLVL